MNKASKEKLNKVWKNSYIALVFLFLYLPIFVVILFSFNTSKMNIVFQDFTFKWYGTFFKNRSLMEALLNTLIIGIVSTAVLFQLL